MSTTQYLYGYGRTKHVAAEVFSTTQGISICGRVLNTESEMKSAVRRWNRGTAAERFIAQRLALPVGKQCQPGSDSKPAV